MLDEGADPGGLRSAYIVTRNGEDFLVPSGLLTKGEMEAIMDANGIVSRLYRAEVKEICEGELHDRSKPDVDGAARVTEIDGQRPTEL